MEHRRFPWLRIVKGTIGEDGKASNKDLGEAVEWCDFLLHGSGPYLVAKNDVRAFLKHTEKAFGIFGISYLGSYDEMELINQAKFAWFRDSISLQKAEEMGIKCRVARFGPDAAFFVDVRNEDKAQAFLRANGLEDGKFLCCIPRLRYTPYWIHS